MHAHLEDRFARAWTPQVSQPHRTIRRISHVKRAERRLQCVTGRSVHAVLGLRRFRDRAAPGGPGPRSPKIGRLYHRMTSQCQR